MKLTYSFIRKYVELGQLSQYSDQAAGQKPGFVSQQIQRCFSSQPQQRPEHLHPPPQHPAW